MPRKDSDTQAEHCVITEAEIRVMKLKSKECLCMEAPARSWEEARKDSLLQLLKGAWPCCHLDFGLPSSRTVR